MKKVISMLLCLCLLTYALPCSTADAATVWEPLYEAKWPDFYNIVNLDEYDLFEDMATYEYVMASRVTTANDGEIFRIFLTDSVRGYGVAGCPSLSFEQLKYYDVKEADGVLTILRTETQVLTDGLYPSIDLSQMVGSNFSLNFETYPELANLHWANFGQFFAYTKKDIPTIYELTNSGTLYETDSYTSPYAIVGKYLYYIVTYDETADTFYFYGTNDLPTTDFLNADGSEAETPMMHITSDEIGYFEAVNVTGGYRAENNQFLSTEVHLDMRTIVGSNYNYADKVHLNNLLYQNYHPMSDNENAFPVWEFARASGTEDFITDVKNAEYATITYMRNPSPEEGIMYIIVFSENKPERDEVLFSFTGNGNYYFFGEVNGELSCLGSKRNCDISELDTHVMQIEYTNYEYDGLDYFTWRGNNFTFTDTTNGDMDIYFTMNASEVNIVVPLSVECYINPNEADGFVYGDLTITNNSVAPVKVYLQSFEQKNATKTFLLPDGLSDIEEGLTWETLNVNQSKQYYSVGTRPLASEEDAWYQNLAPDFLYVGNIGEKTALGVIYPDKTAPMEIEAYYGRCFDTADSFSLQISFIAEFCAD